MIRLLIVMIILSFINMGFFGYVIVNSQYYIIYFIFSFLTYLLYRQMYFKHSEEYQGLPIELYFFLPGLGGVLVSMTLLLLYYIRTDSLMIEDYENYIRFQNNRLGSADFDYNASVQTMSAIDAMAYYNDALKKELIVNYNNKLKKERIDLLRLGNLDEDTEVQHYAAVTLNTLENELNAEIRELHEKLKKSNNRQVLDRLLVLYKDYISSSLLDRDTIQIYNNAYVKLLEKRIESVQITYEYALDLYQAYLRQMSFNKARQHYQVMKNDFGERPEMLLLKMNLDFQVRNMEAMKENTKKMKKIYYEQEKSLTKKQISQIAFWIGVYRKGESS